MLLPFFIFFPGFYLYWSSFDVCEKGLSCGVSFMAVYNRSHFPISTLVLVAAVSPAASSYSETLSTLRYAAHARNIVNKPRVNEVSGCLAFDGENQRLIQM